MLSDFYPRKIQRTAIEQNAGESSALRAPEGRPMRGPRGPKGDKGERGERGMRGKNGLQGSNASITVADDHTFLNLSNGELTTETIPIAAGGTNATTAADARSQLDVDKAGTDNSTPVTLTSVANNYLTLTDQEITANTVPIALGGTGSTTAAAARTALDVDKAGTDNSTPVTLTSVANNYLTLTDQEITANTVPIALGGTGSTTAAAARTALDVDKAGTDNSTNVTLANTNYLSLNGQVLTGNTIPISSGGTGTATTDAKKVFIGPTSGSAAPSFRVLAASDLPIATSSTVGAVREGSNVVISSDGAISALVNNTFGTSASAGSFVLLAPSQSGGAVTLLSNISSSLTIDPPMSIVGENIASGVTLSSHATMTVGGQLVSVVSAAGTALDNVVVGQYIGFGGGNDGRITIHNGSFVSGAILTQDDILRLHDLENLNYTAFYNIMDSTTIISSSEIGPLTPTEDWGNGKLFTLNAGATTFTPNVEYLNKNANNIAITSPLSVFKASTGLFAMQLSNVAYKGVYNIKITLEMTRDEADHEHFFTLKAMYGSSNAGTLQQCPGNSIASAHMFSVDGTTQSPISNTARNDRAIFQLDFIQEFTTADLTNLLVLQTFLIQGDPQRVRSFDSSNCTDTLGKNNINIHKFQVTATYLGK